MQYWPRKRARRIYPRTSRWHGVPGVEGFAAWKAGMTHIRASENNPKAPGAGKILSHAVTILDAPPLFVCGIRYYKKTTSGLRTVGERWVDKFPKNLDIQRKGIKNPASSFSGEYDNLGLIVSTQPSKSGMRKKKPDVFELSIGGSPEEKQKYAGSVLGKELFASDIFKEGDTVDVSAVTKGHGFTGPVKRFGIRIQGRKDKQMHRHTGSIGSWIPRKVDWRVPLSGQYGFFTRTESGHLVAKIGTDPSAVIPEGGFVGYGLVKNSYIIIKGSIPGSRKRLIRLRKTGAPARPLEIRSISTSSKG